MEVMLADEAQFHWSEGMKYVNEGIRSVILLNGAAAVAILTFAGNTHINPSGFFWPIIFFASGALSGVASFFLAYLTQLLYGNAVRNAANPALVWSQAGRFHIGAYVSVLFGMVMFAVGSIMSAYSLLGQSVPAVTYPYWVATDACAIRLKALVNPSRRKVILRAYGCDEAIENTALSTASPIPRWK